MKTAIVKWRTGDDIRPSGDTEVRTFKYKLPGWCQDEPREIQELEAWQELCKLAHYIGIIRVTRVSVEIVTEN